jgi:hypothetical protein
MVAKRDRSRSTRKPRHKITAASGVPLAEASLRRPKSHVMLLEATEKGCPLSDDREERNKVFGMPRGVDPHARQDEEPQRVLGVPADWYGPIDWDWLRSLRRPIKAYKRWTLRRCLGPYAPDDEGGSEPTR